MKKCNYCDSVIEDSHERCPYCGGNVFSPVKDKKASPSDVTAVSAGKNKVPAILGKIVMWVVSVFVFLCFMVYLPHYSSFIFLLSLFFLLPIDKLTEIRARYIGSRLIRILIAAAAVIAAVMLTPTPV